MEANKHDALANSLKIPANATSYGLFVEVNPVRTIENKKVEIFCGGGQDLAAAGRVTHGGDVEELGFESLRNEATVENVQNVASPKVVRARYKGDVVIRPEPLANPHSHGFLSHVKMGQAWH